MTKKNFSVCFLISCHSNFPSKSSVKRLKTCKMLVPNTLLHTRMIKELICVFFKRHGTKKKKKTVMVCFQTSSLWNGILKLYLQEVKGTIINLYFFPNSVSKSWATAFRGKLHFLHYRVLCSSARCVSTQEGNAPLQDLCPPQVSRLKNYLAGFHPLGWGTGTCSSVPSVEPWGRWCGPAGPACSSSGQCQPGRVSGSPSDDLRSLVTEAWLLL